MPDIAQQTSDLRQLPDQALQHELTQPSGIMPSYLVLAEAQRRQLMRSAAQKQQGQSGTVMDDIVRNMMSGQPAQGGPPPPAGMVPPKQGQAPPGMTGAAPPVQMGLARGGPIRFADGDLVADPGAPPGGWQGTGEIAALPGTTGSGLFSSPSSAPAASDEINALPGTTRPGLFTGDAATVDDWIDKYSRKFGVDPNLARAVMQQESQGKQGAVSKKGARGRFQLMPGTAKEMDVDPDDPEQNIAGGIHYLSRMLDRFGDVRKALAAYNAGPGTVQKYGDVPPFGETRNYVSSVLNKYNQLNRVPPVSHELTNQLEAEKPAQEVAAEQSTQGADRAAEKPVEKPVEETGEEGGEDGGEDGGEEATTTEAAAPAKPASYVMPGAREFDPFNPANIDKQRQLYYTIFGGSPERQQQLDAQRAATIAQLQGLQQDTINRYRNPSPWSFLSHIAAGMGASRSLSLPLMFGEGVGQAWTARDQEQNQALTQAEQLQSHIDAIQNVGGTERERMGRDMVTMLGQQNKMPGGAAKFEDFVKMPGAIYGAMDPKQSNQGAPRAGMMGVPDPGHPGFGVWIDQNQATVAPKGQQLTGMFEKDFLPGWAEENGTTTDKMTGAQRQQAFKDYRAAMVDPSIKEAALEIAKGIEDGTTPPDMKGLYRYGGQVRAILHQHGYDLTTSMRDWTNLTKYYAGLNGPQQIKMRQATEQVSETLPNLRTLYKAWQATGLPTGYKAFNKAALTAATNLPGAQGVAARQLQMQIHDLTFELGSMYTGGNATTDKALQLAGQNLQAEWNPEQFEGAVKQLETNVKIRRNSMRNVDPVGVSSAGQQQYMVKPQGGGAGTSDNTPPPRPAGIPPSAAAQWNPARKQWRYKKPGSDTWEVLPPQ